MRPGSSVDAFISALNRPHAAAVEFGHRMPPDVLQLSRLQSLRALRRRCRGWKIAQVLDQGLPGSAAWWLGVDREPRQAPAKPSRRPGE